MTLEEPTESVLSYRLGEVEKAVKANNRLSESRDQTINSKLDKFLETKERVLINSMNIDSLLKSRDRIVAAISTLATAIILLFLQQIFKLF